MKESKRNLQDTQLTENETLTGLGREKVSTHYQGIFGVENLGGGTENYRDTLGVPASKSSQSRTPELQAPNLRET